MPPLLSHCVVVHAALTLVTGRPYIRWGDHRAANLAKPLALVPLRGLEVPVREEDPRVGNGGHVAARRRDCRSRVRLMPPDLSPGC
eukprot:1909160-Pyramimonas_sp.AAC.1